MNDQVLIDSTTVLNFPAAYPWVESLLYNAEKASTFTYIQLLLLGFLLFSIFFLLRKIVIPLIKRRSIKDAFEQILPVIEAVTAIIFSIVSIFYLVIPYPLLGLIFLAIIIGGTWGFLRDYFAGLLFRFTNNFRPGHRIKIENQSGVIKHLGRLAVEIEVENGELLIMPYGQLANASLIRESQSENVYSYAFELEIPEKMRHPEIKNHLRSKILNLPWSVGARDPYVEKIDATSPLTYQVVLYSISDKYFPLMEEKLRSELA